MEAGRNVVATRKTSRRSASDPNNNGKDKGSLNTSDPLPCPAVAAILPNKIKAPPPPGIKPGVKCSVSGGGVVSRDMGFMNNLPYMGELTFDTRPRRGRKPKKADICHLISKNYGIQFPNRPNPALLAPPIKLAPKTGLSVTTLRRAPVKKIVEPLRSLGPGSSPPGFPWNFLPELIPVPSQPHPQISFAVNMKGAGLNREAHRGADEPLNLCLRDSSDDPRSARTPLTPIRLCPGKSEKVAYFPPSTNPKPSRDSNLVNSNAPPLDLPESAPATQRRKRICSGSSSNGGVGPWPPSPAKRPPTAARARIRSSSAAAAAAAVAAANSAEVSICKFKFTGGAKPSLQEKKMLSVDSGGNFRFFSDKPTTGSVGGAKGGGGASSPGGGGAPGRISRDELSGQFADSSTLPRSAKSMSMCMMPSGGAPGGPAPLSPPEVDPLELKEEELENSSQSSESGEGEEHPASPSLRPLERGKAGKSKRKRRTRKSLMREKLEKTFKEKGFLIQTQQLESAEGATYCKFRQLRKFTRYLFRSWKDYLPDTVKDIGGTAGAEGRVTDPAEVEPSPDMEILGLKAEGMDEEDGEEEELS